MDRKGGSKTYFLGSERSTDNFLVFANSSIEDAKLFPDTDWTQPGSAYDCGMELETPAA